MIVSAVRVFLSLVSVLWMVLGMLILRGLCVTVVVY